ncbi:hypothetical protein BGZ65_010715, partial [Modicella reniformis]
PRGDVIRQVLKNTAKRSSNINSKTLASVAIQGAGLVNALSAIETTNSITPDHIDLLDSEHFHKTVKISIKNNGRHSETYTLSHAPADALNSYPNGNSFPLPRPIIEADYATVSFSESKVKISAGKTVKVTLKFKAPKKGNADHFPIYSGFVVATPKSKGGVAVHVPYTGLKGDVAKVPIFDTDLGFPLALHLDNTTEIIQPFPNNFKFDLVNNFPVIVTRLGSHTPDLTFRVFEAGSGKFVGFIDSLNNGPGFGWAGRDYNLDADGNPVYNVWVWGGSVFAKEDSSLTPTRLPGGDYTLIAAAQKKLTKGSFPKDFESFKVGTVKIA